MDDFALAAFREREARQILKRRAFYLHFAVYIAVQGSDGRLLVHQRSFDKDVRPGAWDIAVGGVVGAGEAYDDAAARELAEEIGVVGVPLTLLTKSKTRCIESEFPIKFIKPFSLVSSFLRLRFSPSRDFDRSAFEILILTSSILNGFVI